MRDRRLGRGHLLVPEILRLRTYLLKGGFLWVDDSWGPDAWSHWVRTIGSVLPPNEYPIVDIPMDHALLRTMFNVTRIPQIPAISHWRRSGGGTSERGAASAEVVFRGIKADQTPTEMHFFVDARNGKVLDKWDTVQTATPGGGTGGCVSATAAVGSGKSLTLELVGRLHGLVGAPRRGLVTSRGAGVAEAAPASETA